MPTTPQLESDLSRPISRWFGRQRFKVYAEVPRKGRGYLFSGQRGYIDLVCVAWRQLAPMRVATVELKGRLDSKAVFQAAVNHQFGSESWIATFSASDRMLRFVGATGIGLLLVRKSNGRYQVEPVLKPNTRRLSPSAVYLARRAPFTSCGRTGGVATSTPEQRRNPGRGDPGVVLLGLQRVRLCLIKPEALLHHYRSNESMESAMRQLIYRRNDNGVPCRAMRVRHMCKCDECAAASQRETRDKPHSSSQ